MVRRPRRALLSGVVSEIASASVERQLGIPRQSMIVADVMVESCGRAVVGGR